MPQQTLHFFVSATTSDLGSYRVAVRAQLQSRGIFPVTQEDFLPDYREIRAILRDKIVRCDAVICLIGVAFGAAPRKGDDPLRSYTQMEYDIARELGKPIYLFIASESTEFDKAPQASLEELASQTRHRETIQSGDQLWREFSTVLELRKMIAEIDLPESSASEKLPFHEEHTPPRPAYFYGREFELAQLEKVLLRPQPSVVAVIGIGGQGKTTLVARWLGTHRQDAYVGGYWCTAYRGEFTFDAFVDGMLSYLTRGSFDKRGHQSLADRTTLLLSKLKASPILIVIDGIERWLQGWHQETGDLAAARTLDQRYGYVREVDRFLEEMSGLHSGTRLIVTTRALPAALDDLEVAIVPVTDEEHPIAALEGLDDQAAVDLLKQLGVLGEPAELLRAARQYDKHPLALTVLGRLLKKRYAGRLSGLDQLSPVDAPDRLAELLDNMRESLPSREHAEAFLQVAASCFENPTLETIVAGMAGDTTETSADLAVARQSAVDLKDWHVIDFDAYGDVVRLHALVKHYFASQISHPAKIHERLSGWYANLPVGEASSTLPDAKARILAIRHAIMAALHEDLGRLAFGAFTPTYTFVRWLIAWGHLETGIELAAEAAATVSGRLKSDFTMSEAVMLATLGRHSEAESRLDEVIESLESAVRSGDSEAAVATAKAYISRSNVHFQQQRYPESLVDVELALGLLNEHATEFAIHEYADAFVNHGNILLKLGRLSDAVQSHDRAEAMLNVLNSIGDYRLALADLAMNRGVAYLFQAKPAEAISELQTSRAAYDLLISEGGTELIGKRARVLIMLGAAYNIDEQSKQASETLDAAIYDLKHLVDEGRKDVESLLALAHLNRVHAYLHDQCWDLAIEESDLSLRFYVSAIANGQAEFESLQSHALLDRAEALYRLNRLKESKVDRVKGLQLSQKCIDRGDASLHRPRFDKIVRIVLYLDDQHLVETIPMLVKALTDIRNLLASSNGTESLQVGMSTLLSKLEQHRGRLEKIGLDWSIVGQISLNLTPPPLGRP